jgi:Ca-activated chloride channel family protein
VGAADWAVKILLSRLGDDDAFNLGFFHDTCRWMSRAPVKATEKNRQRGERFIAESTDSGGTELGIALEQALLQPRSGGRVARHVVVLTDAQVGDHDRIAALLEREAARARTSGVSASSASTPRPTNRSRPRWRKPGAASRAS